MIALAPREFHLFQAAGRDFLYLVPSAAIFALDEPTSAVLRVVTERGADRTGRRRRAVPDRFDAGHGSRCDRRAAARSRAIGYEHQPEPNYPRSCRSSGG